MQRLNESISVSSWCALASMIYVHTIVSHTRSAAVAPSVRDTYEGQQPAGSACVANQDVRAPRH